MSGSSEAIQPSYREDPVTKNVTVTILYPHEGVKEEEFDMVVLSIGMDPPKDVQNLVTDLRHRT